MFRLRKHNSTSMQNLTIFVDIFRVSLKVIQQSASEYLHNIIKI